MQRIDARNGRWKVGKLGQERVKKYNFVISAVSADCRGGGEDEEFRVARAETRSGFVALRLGLGRECGCGGFGLAVQSWLRAVYPCTHHSKSRMLSTWINSSPPRLHLCTGGCVGSEVWMWPESYKREEDFIATRRAMVKRFSLRKPTISQERNGRKRRRLASFKMTGGVRRVPG